MNTFLRAIGAMLVVATTSAASAALHIPVPEAGDCNVMQSQSGDFELWLGRFSGAYEDLFDTRRPIAVRGCFLSEYECRRWINEVQSAVVNPGLMSCERIRPR